MDKYIYWNPKEWQINMKCPQWSDPRWMSAGLLTLYAIIGISILGFTRQPLQLLVLCCAGMLIDVLFEGLLKGKLRFPLSSYMSCLSLGLLLNFSLGYSFLWIPIGIAIASKYLLTLNGKHLFNPSMFAICMCLFFGGGWVNLAPAYQWVGTVESTWLVSAFMVTGALIAFACRIQRHWLILSFLFFYALQTALRAYILRYHIPWETLVIGTLTAPAFYLFTFFMITDPKTSPPQVKSQIIVGFFIALLDLYYHTQMSLYTFFYAALTVAGCRFTWGHFQNIKSGSQINLKKWGVNFAIWSVYFVPAIFIYLFGAGYFLEQKTNGLIFEKIDSKISNIGSEKSNVLELVDPRVQNVGKWILSVGDAVAMSDVDNDGDVDLFLTQTLKSQNFKGKLWLNEGDFKFKKVNITELDSLFVNVEENGLPSNPIFWDFDNDGDQDLYIGFEFGESRLFENNLIPTGKLEYKLYKRGPFLDNYSVSVSANVFDFNQDGRLDLLQNQVVSPYFSGYDKPVKINIFKLPQPEYTGDRRMFHFMHDSWSNANNGGKNSLWLNADTGFKPLDSDEIGLKETRWSLASGTGDFNNDGWPDLYIANDFGRDDAYLNQNGHRWIRQEGKFFQDLGLDSYKGMNTSIGDVDGDLREDIYISNVHHALQAEGSLLWLNKTPTKATHLHFEERATQMGVLNDNRFGWGAAMADLDRDGWLDIVQANGMVDDSWDKVATKCIDYWYLNEKLARTGPEIHSYSDSWADIKGACIYPNEKNRVYLNQKGQYFSDVASQVGLTDLSNTRGVASGDLDNDGDLDLVITDLFGAPKIYKNKVKNNFSWIGLDMVGNGKTCNRDAIGTQVYLTTPLQKQMREVRAMTGLSAQSDSRLFFGLNADKSQSLQLKIIWCGQKEQNIFIQGMNQYHQITQK